MNNILENLVVVDSMLKTILTFRCNHVNSSYQWGLAFLKFLKFENTFIMLFVISGTTLWTSTSFQLCWRLCSETKRVDPIPWTLSSAMKSSTSSTKVGWDVYILLLLRFNIFNKDVRLLLLLFSNVKINSISSTKMFASYFY